MILSVGVWSITCIIWSRGHSRQSVDHVFDWCLAAGLHTNSSTVGDNKSRTSFSCIISCCFYCTVTGWRQSRKSNIFYGIIVWITVAFKKLTEVNGWNHETCTVFWNLCLVVDLEKLEKHHKIRISHRVGKLNFPVVSRVMLASHGIHHDITLFHCQNNNTVRERTISTLLHEVKT